MNVARTRRGTGNGLAPRMGGLADKGPARPAPAAQSGAPLDTVEAAGYRALGGRGSGGRSEPASLHPTSKGDGNVEDGGRVTGALPSPTPHRGGPVAWEWPHEKGIRGNRTRSVRSAEMRSTRAAAERLLVVALILRVGAERIKTEMLRLKFVSLYVVNEATGCWEWTRALNGNGYGSFCIDSRHPTGAHRAAWELFRGPIPAGMQACHRCDNRRCVNPEHLFLGNQSTNLRDCIDKGRFNPPRGERNARVALTEAGVKEILERRSNGEPMAKIAASFGVSHHAVWSVVTGRTWQHVTKPPEGRQYPRRGAR